jgi:A/G-specific adenine glycosylase
VRPLVPVLLAWFAAQARDLPWRRTRDPYAIWISEIMLQQTQVKTVIPYWNRWITALPTVKSLAAAPPEAVLKLWEGLGYYSRARHLHEAARQIATQHGGRLPHTAEALLALPGIGRYTAGAICSIAFDQPEPILDGNVIRVLTRLFGICSDPMEKRTRGQLWTLARQLVEGAHRLPGRAGDTTPRCSHLNQSLMELGALICTPQAPRCTVCPIRRHCIARSEGRAAQLPNLGPRTKTTARRFLAFVVGRSGRLLVRQRPATGVNALLWEFPNAETVPGDTAPSTAQTAARFAREQLGLHLKNIMPLATVRHSITRHRITLDAWRAQLAAKKEGASKNTGRWLCMEELSALTFTGAHRKILRRIDAARPGHLPTGTASTS